MTYHSTPLPIQRSSKPWVDFSFLLPHYQNIKQTLSLQAFKFCLLLISWVKLSRKMLADQPH